MLGWLLGIGMLKSILPLWLSMQFTAALLFFLCSLIPYFIAGKLETRSVFARIALLMSALINGKRPASS